MKRATVSLATAMLLCGCVSDQEIAARNAQVAAEGRQSSACDAYPTHLARVKCHIQVILRYHPQNGRDNDLDAVAIAAVENEAARIDRHEVTEEQGKLELALLMNNLVNQQQQRNLTATQTIIAAQQAAAANRPVVVQMQQCGGRVVNGIWYNTGC